jgi:hypothetical protein
VVVAAVATVATVVVVMLVSLMVVGLRCQRSLALRRARVFDARA